MIDKNCSRYVHDTLFYSNLSIYIRLNTKVSVICNGLGKTLFIQIYKKDSHLLKTVENFCNIGLDLDKVAYISSTRQVLRANKVEDQITLAYKVTDEILERIKALLRVSLRRY